MADPQKILSARLERGLEILGIEVTTKQLQALLHYQALLVQWNQRFNLTAVRDPEAMIVRHLLDSLAISHCVKNRSIADVGTGAGLPGLPLGIIDEQRKVTLLDSNGKKTRFLNYVKQELVLTNITIEQSRVEDFYPETAFEVVVSRAFTQLDKMVPACRHLLTEGGRVFAMKSQSVSEEIAAMGDVAKVIAIHNIAVPFLDEERVLVELQLTTKDKP